MGVLVMGESETQKPKTRKTPKATKEKAPMTLDNKIRIVKNGTIEAFIHNLKFKSVTYQLGGRGGGMTGLFVGKNIYTYEPRIWYKPFYWVFKKMGFLEEIIVDCSAPKAIKEVDE